MESPVRRGTPRKLIRPLRIGRRPWIGQAAVEKKRKGPGIYPGTLGVDPYLTGGLLHCTAFFFHGEEFLRQLEYDGA